MGIVDDVTHTSLAYDADFSIEADDVVRAVFFGLGSDGTVGANKNSIKIIGEETPAHVQGYFVYDSKKAGARTVSHLRFGPRPIHSEYLIRSANFVACHQFHFLENTRHPRVRPSRGCLPLECSLRPAGGLGSSAARGAGADPGAEAAVLRDRCRARGRRDGAGQPHQHRHADLLLRGFGRLASGRSDCSHQEVDRKDVWQEGCKKSCGAISPRSITPWRHLYEVPVPGRVVARRVGRPPLVPDEAPDFVKRVTAVLMAGKGDLLPVSAFPVDGTWPTGTSRWEKRTIAAEVPIWDPKICIQCNKCALVCPHAAIRAKVFEPGQLQGAPAHFQATDYKAAEFKGWKYTIQVAPQDCTGCNLCVMVCPAKDKSAPRHKAINMAPLAPVLEEEKTNYDFFLRIPDPPRDQVSHIDVKSSQFFLPLFEYSGACPGCGETPYIKLLTQLFGDRLLIANATGCSSIYGGNLPATPYTVDGSGRGPAWSNSLFEDNAEFGLGLRLGIDNLRRQAGQLLPASSPRRSVTTWSRKSSKRTSPRKPASARNAGASSCC